MKNLTRFFIFSLFLLYAHGEVDREDADLDVPELLEKYNYPLETHFVTTEDGYILTVFRIPGSDPNAIPVLLVHGLLGASSDYLLLGPEEALAYKIADAGFDVWLLNVRGTSYSRNHTTLNPNELAFWDFSFEEMGLFDVPNTIEYILNETSQTQIDYVGYSQGCTAGIIFLSMKPEYNSKVRNFYAVSPAAFQRDSSNFFFVTLAPLVEVVGVILDYIGQGELKVSEMFLRILVTALCSDNDIICRNLFFLLFGHGSVNLELNMYHVLVGHYPNTCSTKQIIHFAQHIRKPFFSRYNYGFIENRKQYGSNNPPEYDLTKITTKMHLYYSDGDTMSTKEDVETLGTKLPNSENKFYPGMNHIDVMFGKTAYRIFDDILEMLKS